MDPAIYGEEPHEQTRSWRPDRDAWELALLTSAAAQNLPTLGVCRGMQVMAVATGGTLEQHTPDEVGHEQHSPGGDTFGDIEVNVDEGSALHTILGPAVTVRCHHHQSVRSHPGYVATARAADGSLEAMEAEGTPLLPGSPVAPGGRPRPAPLRRTGQGSRLSRWLRSERSERLETTEPDGRPHHRWSSSERSERSDETRGPYQQVVEQRAGERSDEARGRHTRWLSTERSERTDETIHRMAEELTGTTRPERRESRESGIPFHSRGIPASFCQCSMLEFTHDNDHQHRSRRTSTPRVMCWCSPGKAKPQPTGPKPT